MKTMNLALLFATLWAAAMWSKVLAPEKPKNIPHGRETRAENAPRSDLPDSVSVLRKPLMPKSLTTTPDRIRYTLASNIAITPVRERVAITKSDTKPMGVNEVFSTDTKAYINRFSALAVGEMKKYGIPASISLAQGLIESRAGKSKLALMANNHFGMKCFSKRCRKGHCMNASDDTHKDFFLRFKTAFDSYRAHSKLLSSGRYAKLKRHGRDYRAWAYGLKSVGYATDRTYAEKLIGIIERYDLHRYDR